jgi:hypothetical protein
MNATPVQRSKHKVGRRIWLLSVLLAATPLLAQDDAPAGALTGSGGAQVFTRVDAANPMDQVKSFLSKASITLNSDQEKTLRPSIESTLKQLRESNGRRGGGEEIRKLNDDLIAKITAVLKPDQQAAFKKFQNDEIKKAGGFGALKIVMEEAGAPLSAEQQPQIEAFYNEDAQQRAALVRESQGHPDPAKLADLQKATMAKVVKVLTPAQRKALLDSRTKQ